MFKLLTDLFEDNIQIVSKPDQAFDYSVRSHIVLPHDLLQEGKEIFNLLNDLTLSFCLDARSDSLRDNFS